MCAEQPGRAQRAALQNVVSGAQKYLTAHDIDGWLLYDYRGSNPIFWETVGDVPHVTRPCWLWVPASGGPKLLVGYVDQGRFAHLKVPTALWTSRAKMFSALREILGPAKRVAMEYSPEGALPRVSRVDGGTLELVRSLGVDVVSSGDLLQHATQRWSEAQLRSHLVVAEKLTEIVQEGFRYIGEELGAGVTELAVAEFIRRRFVESGLEVTDGPIVATNEHSSDPHYDPSAETSRAINEGDWVLVDLWSRVAGEDSVFADITWTAYVGDTVPALHQRVFDTVTGARDAAVSELEAAFSSGRRVEGWEIDKVARDYIEGAGYGEYFNHRLGHSLGREVHGNAVNLDGWETHDTREVVSGIGVTIEPGIYLPEFGVRSEIDVYVSETGPRVTTEVQRSVVLIGG